MAQYEGVGVMQEWQWGNVDMLKGVSADDNFGPFSS